MAGREKKTEIRFKGFTDEWERCKLGKIAEFNPKAELPEIFEYVDLESVVGTEMIAHREERKVTAPSRAQRLARQGDLFYQTVRPYQKNNYLFEMTYNNYVFSTGYAQMRPYGDGYFLISLVQKNEFVKSVLKKCTGTSYPAINSNDLSDMEVFIPVGDAIGNNEQVQIGSFFKNVDNLIALHQRKYDKLVIVKKSMLEKMFPKDGANVPEIRFAGFTDAWEPRKLGEAFNQTIEYVNPQVENIELWSLTVEKGLTPKTDRYVRDFLVKKEDKFKAVRPNDIVYNPMNMTLGAIGYNNMSKTVAVSGYYITMKPTDIIDGYYIKTWMERPYAINLYKMCATGSLIERQRVQYPTFAEIDFIMPEINEQKKIGAYFRNIDNLINLYQRELDKLKNIKQSLIEKMFV